MADRRANGLKRRHRKSSATKNSLGVQKPQGAAGLKETLKHREDSLHQKNMKKNPPKKPQTKTKKGLAFDSSVCVFVLLNSVSACVIFGSGAVAEEVQQEVGEFCLAWHQGGTEANHMAW